MPNINWDNIKYNLYYHYTKKELKIIYQFLKKIERKAKKYNKSKNLKIQETVSLIIKDTAVYANITNNDNPLIADNEIGEIEINLKLIKSMTPNKIDLKDTISFNSAQNYYGGLSLIDYNEYLKLFKLYIKTYDEAFHNKEE